METALPGIFTAGDCNGIEGAAVAAEEGRLAAIKICQELGHITPEEAGRRCSPIFKKLRGLRRFESALNNIFAIRRGLLAQIPDEVIICRCEEVTAGEIRRVIAEGMTNVNEIKVLTRAGMGPCQGRMCAPIIAEMVSIETNRPVEEVGFSTPRPPIKPIPLVGVARYKSS
jgi:bacterioferritin-associated ferredoxin